MAPVATEFVPSLNVFLRVAAPRELERAIEVSRRVFVSISAPGRWKIEGFFLTDSVE